MSAVNPTLFNKGTMTSMKIELVRDALISNDTSLIREVGNVVNSYSFEQLQTATTGAFTMISAKDTIIENTGILLQSLEPAKSAWLLTMLDIEVEPEIYKKILPNIPDSDWKYEMFQEIKYINNSNLDLFDHEINNLLMTTKATLDMVLRKLKNDTLEKFDREEIDQLAQPILDNLNRAPFTRSFSKNTLISNSKLPLMANYLHELAKTDFPFEMEKKLIEGYLRLSNAINIYRQFEIEDILILANKPSEALTLLSERNNIEVYLKFFGNRHIGRALIGHIVWDATNKINNFLINTEVSMPERKSLIDQILKNIDVNVKGAEQRESNLIKYLDETQ